MGGILLAIDQITMADIRRAVRAALHDGLHADMMADFCAAVDWSRADGASVQVRKVLGRLHILDTEYAEGDRSRESYIAELQDIAQARVA